MSQFSAQLAAEILDFEALAEPPPLEPVDDEGHQDSEAGQDCPRCEEALEPEASFCGNCGLPIKAAPIPAPEPETRPPSAQPEQKSRGQRAYVPPTDASIDMVEPPPPTPNEADYDDEPAPPPRRNRAILAGFAALALAGAGGAYWYNQDRSDPASVASALQAELGSAGFGRVLATVGPDSTIVLSGLVDNQEQHERLLALAQAFPGAGTINDTVAIRHAAADHIDEINRLISQDFNQPAVSLAYTPESGFTLTGTLNGMDNAQPILDVLRTRYAINQVNSLVSRSPVEMDAAAAVEPPATFAGNEDAQSGAAFAPAPSQAAAIRRPVEAQRPLPARVPRAVPTSSGPTVDCLLPSAAEARLSLNDCRSRGGLVQ